MLEHMMSKCSVSAVTSQLGTKAIPCSVLLCAIKQLGILSGPSAMCKAYLSSVVVLLCVTGME